MILVAAITRAQNRNNHQLCQSVQYWLEKALRGRLTVLSDEPFLSEIYERLFH